MRKLLVWAGWSVVTLNGLIFVLFTPNSWYCSRNAAVVSTHYDITGASAQLVWSDGLTEAYKFDTAAPERSLRLEGYNGTLLSVAWSPDGRYVVAASQDGNVSEWEAASGTLVWRLPDQAATRVAANVAWSADGQTFLTLNGFDDLWDASTGKLQKSLQGSAYVESTAAWSPDSKKLLTGSMDGNARIFEVSTGDVLQTLPGHTQGVWSAAWSPDGKSILTGSQDGLLHLWDSKTGALLISFQGHRGMVRSIAWSPKGDLAVTGGDDFTARLWEPATGTLLHTLQGHRREIWDVEWSPDGRTVLTSGLDGAALLWDVSTGGLIRPLCPRLLGQEWVATGLALMATPTLALLTWKMVKRHRSILPMLSAIAPAPSDR